MRKGLLELAAQQLLESRLAKAYARKDLQLAQETEFELEELDELGGLEWVLISGKVVAG